MSAQQYRVVVPFGKSLDGQEHLQDVDQTSQNKAPADPETDHAGDVSTQGYFQDQSHMMT